MSEFTDQEKYECAIREVKWRKRVYANRINTGRMKRPAADREIALMTEIAEDYRLRTELGVGPLFTHGDKT